MKTAIDLFAGAGGFSTAARQAGVKVLWCANHWPAAVAAHAANHPSTIHACQDLHQADFTQAPAHDILLASPSCQGHARARGKERPSHDAARATAWAVVTCAKVHRPKAVIVENVPEFLDWVLYPAWVAAMQALGYVLEPHVCNSADYGVPQERIRVIIVATRGRPLGLVQPKLPHVPARDIIDLSTGNWSAINKPGRAAATLERIANGRAAHGREFLISYYGNTRTGRSLDRPIGTITTKARWAVVSGDRMRMLTREETIKAMGFPADYALPPDTTLSTHLLGNAVPPAMAQWFIEQVAADI